MVDWLPGLALLKSTRRGFREDVVAGVVLTGLLIPAGMGYAEVAGLPAVTGLYATIVGLLAYALFGPSRRLVVGPDSSLAPMIAAAIAPVALGDPDRRVALAGLLAILTGVLLLVGGLLRLGFAMDLLSKPIRLGFLSGVAAVVVVGQLPKLFGFSEEANGLLNELEAFVSGLANGRADPTATMIGIASLVTIVIVRRLAPKVPSLMVAVAGAAIIVWMFELAVPVVGRLPQGIPTPNLVGIGWGDVGALAPAALGIAIVAFADTGVLARAVAMRDRERPRDNRELTALGLTNIACGTLGGFAVSGSSSRTPVALASGARSQLTGVVGAAVVALLVVFAPGVTAYVPSAALAAVVIAAAVALADPVAVARLSLRSRAEFGLALASFLGVALFGVLRGVGVAVALSLLIFVIKASRPYTAELVRIDRRKGYHDVRRHPEGRRIPGLAIVRFDAPLFFGNSTVFGDHVRSVVDASDQLRWVVVAAEPITDIDITAGDELADLDDELRDRGIRLVLAELKGPVKDKLARLGLGARFSPDRIFPTLGTAVSAYVAETGTAWVDWTDADTSDGESG
jgi:high affinity sulfate transporter 1